MQQILYLAHYNNDDLNFLEVERYILKSYIRYRNRFFLKQNENHLGDVYVLFLIN